MYTHIYIYISGKAKVQDGWQATRTKLEISMSNLTIA